MKKYDLVKRTAEFNYKNRKNIEEGCTALDPSPEYIKTFDDLEDAKKELAKRKTSDFRPLSGNYISQYHPYNPATSLGSWSGLRGKNIFGKINKIHSLKSAANSVFKPCAAKSKQIFSFIKKYQFHIVPSYILFPDSGYISKYVVKPSFLYLYNVYDLVAHLFCQRYLLLFQYLLFHQT